MGATKYRATQDMKYPADEESLRHAKAGRMDKVKWASAKPGEPVEPYCDEILRSWQANEAVEEVK